MTKFDNRNKLSGSSVSIRISARGAVIIPKMEYIRTPGADMNELSVMLDKNYNVDKHGRRYQNHN